jgi:hypothetical protein
VTCAIHSMQVGGGVCVGLCGLQLEAQAVQRVGWVGRVAVVVQGGTNAQRIRGNIEAPLLVCRLSCSGEAA